MKPRSKHLFNLAVFTSPTPSSLYKSLMKRAEKIQITSESFLKFKLLKVLAKVGNFHPAPCNSMKLVVQEYTSSKRLIFLFFFCSFSSSMLLKSFRYLQ